MTQDEIIEMARKSGSLDFYEINAGIDGDEDALLAFAKLVAEKEREACALIADQVSNNTTIHVLEKYSASEIAKSIRARGQA